MSNKYCIVCRGRVKGGRRVLSDPVLSAAMGIKQVFGILNSSGKELVVCPKCIPVHGRMRASFMNKIKYLGAVALLIFAVQTYIVSIWAGIIFAAFLLSLSLIYYAPAVEGEEEPIPSKNA